MTIDKKYVDQFINVTSKAAIASSHLVGKKDKAVGVIDFHQHRAHTRDAKSGRGGQTDGVGGIRINLTDLRKPALKLLEGVLRQGIGIERSLRKIFFKISWERHQASSGGLCVINGP